MKNYDFTIVGSGLYGAVFAQQKVAQGKRVQMIEARPHIGGQVFTERRDGIDLHMYGPHIFHTNSKEIWDYVNQFSEFNNFTLRVKARYGHRMYSFPINLMTIHQVEQFVDNPERADFILKCWQWTPNTPDREENLETWAISQVGKKLYDMFIYGYTKKQWDREPKELPASIIKRLPIRTSFDDSYFKNDRYQGIPVDGYTSLIEKMLRGVDVHLGHSFKRSDYQTSMGTLVWTGPIDGFYDYHLGTLDYRSLKFNHEFKEIRDFQGCAVINHTEYSVPYTRSVEHKHFMVHDQAVFNQEKTWVTYEFPQGADNLDGTHKDPYYPIRDAANLRLYEDYKSLIPDIPVRFGGRLGTYQYWDMDQVIASALKDAR